MINKRECARALAHSLFHMSAFLRRAESYELSFSKVDLLYATFQQLLALSYEQEAIEFGLESKEMHKFMCDFYGKDLT